VFLHGSDIFIGFRLDTFPKMGLWVVFNCLGEAKREIAWVSKYLVFISDKTQ
jgi:hypothetical protein